MQQIRSHYRWFWSFRRSEISAFLVVALFLFTLVNATILIVAQKPQTVQAQTIPQLAKTTEDTKEAPVAEVALATSAPASQTTDPKPTPAPAPKPAAAATPMPAYDKISIASIGLSSRFVTVGLTSQNAIDVHPSLVGWWNGSAQPGSPGTVFLDGHNPGIFSKLPLVKEGAQISLTKASGEIFNYSVVQTEIVQLAGINMRAALSVYGGASEGLNLMTCVGKYNPKTGTTDQRLIVYAIRS